MRITDHFERLIEAAEDGDLEAASDLLASVPALCTQTDPDFKWTALHRAARFGHVNMVSLLLQSGACPNAKDKWRNTPLHDAAMADCESVSVLDLLIQHGGKVDVRNTSWASPLMTSAQYSNLSGFLYLLKAGAKVDYVDRRKSGLREIVKYQLEGLPAGRRFLRQRNDLEAMLRTIETVQQSDSPS